MPCTLLDYLEQFHLRTYAEIPPQPLDLEVDDFLTR
jgi:hypothetical protein